MSTISVGPVYFAAGHRILGLKGPGAKCRNLHGHTFGVTWTYQQDDSLEFGQMKHLLKGMIKNRFDHLFFCDESDDLKHYLEVNNLRFVTLDGPPTTERIAEKIAQTSMEVFQKPVDEWSFYPKPHPADGEEGYYPNSVLVSVHLTEGPENSVTWTRDQFKPVTQAYGATMTSGGRPSGGGGGGGGSMSTLSFGHASGGGGGGGGKLP